MPCRRCVCWRMSWQPCPVLPVLVFAAYAAAVLHLTGAGTLGDGLIYQMQFGGEQVNLLPFSR